MRTLAIVLAASLAMGGCSTLQKDKPPSGCDGKQRRPANPYGSVLDPTTPPTPQPAAPEKLSAAPSTSRSCAA